MVFSVSFCVFAITWAPISLDGYYSFLRKGELKRLVKFGDRPEFIAAPSFLSIRYIKLKRIKILIFYTLYFFSKCVIDNFTSLKETDIWAIIVLNVGSEREPVG